MKVTLAKTAGFCFGVERAVNTVYQQIAEHKGKKIYTYGPIIHNALVTKDFEEQGVSVVQNLSDLEALEKGIMIIRSHGITKAEQEQIEKHGFTIVDATCPFVKRIHRIVEEHSKQGEHIIIVGNPKHPEVQGIVGWSEGPVTVIQSKEEAQAFSLDDKNTKMCIVSQTTFNYNKFQEIIEILSKIHYNNIVSNTICSATKERQKEAFDVASSVDAMIVIGDKHSSNTQKLFEICKNACITTYYIQTL
ncbi:MAG: 4-hydroxy-3-methylbut-2-enyl diphosphate reductase, partial [Dorea sp.]|nr:4-hydroxy-3-methylbut-2-enyl diphosphate reductase [Dorea sp.]